MNKILITGAGGFLGTAIAKQLINLGYKVYNFSRSTYPHLKKLGVISIQGDLSDFYDVQSALLGKAAVFHVASKTGMWGRYSDFYQTNVVGTNNIIKGCKRLGVKHLIYTSSPSVVFGRDDLLGVDESCSYPKIYLSNYAQTKAEAEKLVIGANNSSKLSTVSIRPHLIWGPGDPHIIPRLISRAKKGRLRIIGEGDNLVDVTFVDNAATAHVQAYHSMLSGNQVCGKSYFIGQEQPVKLWDFINRILEVKGISPVKKSVSFNHAYKIGSIFESIYSFFGYYRNDPPMTRFIALQMAKSHYFSHENAHKDFGYTPIVGIEEGLKRL